LVIPFDYALLLASTVYHAGVVTSQVGNALACRSDRSRSSSLGWLSNKYLWFSVLIEILGIVAIIYVPFLANIFRHVPLPGWVWLALSLNAFVLYSIEWIRKAFVRSVKNMRNKKSSALSIQEVTQ
jgi:magnesium-transporting ATPase (P-type)